MDKFVSLQYSASYGGHSLVLDTFLDSDRSLLQLCDLGWVTELEDDRLAGGKGRAAKFEGKDSDLQ